MNYLGDFSVGAVVMAWFNTFDSNDPSASVTMTNFINTDVHIHKDDGLTQRNNAAGITVDVDVDAITGVHFIKIDTADNTVADFFEAGHDYAVRIEGVTVDGATLNPVVATFSIANRRVAGQMCTSSIESLASQTSFTLTTGEASANDDAYNGCTIIVTDQVTKIQKAIGHISDYTGATRTITLHAAPLQTAFTMAVGDSVEIIATSVFANVNTVGQTLQTANDNGAGINEILTDTGTTLENRLIAIEADTDVIDDGTSGLVKIASDVAAALVATNSLNDTKVSAARLQVLDDWINGGRLDLLLDAIPTTPMRGTDGALTDKTGFSLSAAGVTAIWDETINTATVGASPTTARTKLQAIWNRAFNKKTVIAALETSYEADDITVMETWTLSDDDTTASRVR